MDLADGGLSEGPRWASSTVHLTRLGSGVGSAWGGTSGYLAQDVSVPLKPYPRALGCSTRPHVLCPMMAAEQTDPKEVKRMFLSKD